MKNKKKIKTWHWVFFLVIFATGIGLRIWQNKTPIIQVELKNQILDVMLAKTIYQQQKGLGGRESLDPYDGMVFVYSDLSRPVMVMRDMEFSIDIVWFEGGKVIDIASSLPLEPGASENELTRYYPRKKADLVLQLPAGWVEENILKIGDKISLVEG